MDVTLDLAAIVAILVSLVALRNQSRLTREMGWSNEDDQRRRELHDRMAQAYTDVHASGSELLRWLRTVSHVRLPRVGLAVLGLRKITTDPVVRDLGHLRARLELYGAPDDVLDAWDQFDAAIVTLVETQLTLGDVDAASTQSVEAIGEFTRTASAHLTSLVHGVPPAGRPTGSLSGVIRRRPPHRSD